MAKRIGIISDTHGLLRPEVISILKTCDCILHAGDVDRPEILDQLRYLGSLYVVRGNNDRDWAEKLSVTLRFKIEGTEFFMTHNKKDVAWDLGTAQVVIFGHSHHYFEKMIDGRLWLNPGSCGRSRFGGEVTMALMEIDSGNEHIFDFEWFVPFYRTLNMRYSQYKKQMFGKHVRYKGRKPRWSTQQMQKEEFTGQREVTEKRIAGNFPVSWRWY